MMMMFAFARFYGLDRLLEGFPDLGRQEASCSSSSCELRLHSVNVSNADKWLLWVKTDCPLGMVMSGLEVIILDFIKVHLVNILHNEWFPAAGWKLSSSIWPSLDHQRHFQAWSN